MKWNLSAKHAMTLAVLALGLASMLYGQVVPNTDQRITPLAPHDSAFVPMNPGLGDNPDYVAGRGPTSVVSPDGKTLLVLTSGYNLVKNSSDVTIAGDSTQFGFVYDISNYRPVQKQALPVPNTYYGIVFDPSGKAFYVSGSVNDNVHIFALGTNGLWADQAGSPIALGHLAGATLRFALAARVLKRTHRLRESPSPLMAPN